LRNYLSSRNIALRVGLISASIKLLFLLKDYEYLHLGQVKWLNTEGYRPCSIEKSLDFGLPDSKISQNKCIEVSGRFNQTNIYNIGLKLFLSIKAFLPPNYDNSLLLSQTNDFQTVFWLLMFRL